MLQEQAGEAFGDQAIGTHGTAGLGDDREMAQAFIGEDLVQQHGGGRAGRLSLRALAARRSWAARRSVGRGGGRGGLEPADGRRSSLLASSARSPRRIRMRYCWSWAAAASGLPSTRSPGRALSSASGQVLDGELVLAGGFGHARQPQVVDGLVGLGGDLFAVAVDQAAVLAEDEQGVGLGDDEVAVADGQVAAAGAEGLLKRDRPGAGFEAGLGVEHADLGAGGPVDQAAGEQAPPVAFEASASLGPEAGDLAGGGVEQPDAVSGGDDAVVDHAQEVGGLGQAAGFSRRGGQWRRRRRRFRGRRRARR